MDVTKKRDSSKPANEQGVFHKFDVRRTDGSDKPGGKHHGCRYFVLDLDHDPHAAAAMAAYAQDCKATHPALSAELSVEYPPNMVDASTVDRARARFCGAFGDGPDAPYPGMIAAFETHYGQSFRDKEWRTEAACWAAAWHKATELATKTNPQAKEIEMTDEQKQMAYYKAGMLKKAPPFVPARVRVLKEQFGDEPFRGAGVSAGEHDCRCNKWGAVSVSARDGELLGLWPDEFEPVAWRENAPPPETRNDQTCGD